MLEAKDISYRIGNAVLLDSVSLALKPGALTVVIGPNGAGKSTLLRLLARDIAPTTGSILFDNADLNGWTHQALAIRRAVVPQSADIAFPFSVREVVAMGRTPHNGVAGRQIETRLIEAALQRADVAHLAGREFPSLSGGEKQRVHFARALAQIDYRIGASLSGKGLLLDEPTASLDLEHQYSLLGAARDVAKAGATVFTILHDINLAAHFADEIHVLNKGSLVASGAPPDALSEATLQAVFGVPIRTQKVVGGRQIYFVANSVDDRSPSPRPAADP